MEPNGTTKRVELSNDQWADKAQRPMTGDDLFFQAKVRSERGFEDRTLDGIAIAAPFITAWSFGEVSDRDAVLAKIMSLDLVDIDRLISGVGTAGKAVPASSSAGGSTKKGSRRSNG